jgi:hypothetical protein
MANTTVRSGRAGSLVPVKVAPRSKKAAVACPGHTTAVAIVFARAATRRTAPPSGSADRSGLPGALLVTVQTQLLAAFVLVDFRLPAFFQ